MAYTKKSGKVLKKNSKAVEQKCKVTKPTYRWGPIQKNKFLNLISYKKEGKFLKESINQILFYPIPSYRSKKYLVKNTLVKLKNLDTVKITSINFGRLIGVLVKANQSVA